MNEESLTDRDESGSESDPMEEDEESVTGISSCCYLTGGDVFDDMYVPPLHKLEAFVRNWSNRSVGRVREGYLDLSKLVITRRMITRLLPFMLPVVHDDTGTIRNNTPIKFCAVRMENSCRFFSHTDIVMMDDGGNVCTPADKRSFLSALAGVSKNLMIDNNCPEIVSGLLNIPEIDQVKAQTLEIGQGAALWDLEYIRLGAMIRRSVQLQDLTLELPFLDVPRTFLDSLADCIHLKSLSLKSPRRTITSNDERQAILSSLIVGKDGSGIVERLLRNPHSQLRKLALSSTGFEDCHLLAIAQLLPTSRIESIDLSDNRIQTQGLLEFIRRIPRMNSLKFIDFRDNPWEDSPVTDTKRECGEALLQGLIQNPSITEVYKMDPYFPQYPLLWHYVSLNRAGRRILTLSQKEPIPWGLWPHILARAGKCLDNRGPSVIPIQDEETTNYVYNGPANAVYFFLQNCPKLLDYC